MGSIRRPLVLVQCVLGLALVSAVVSAQGRTVWDGVYTAAQATRGAKVYADNCSSCHGGDMKGGGGVPGLSGPDFQFSWDKKSVGALFDYAKSNMPPGQGGSLTDKQYADIVAALLQGNGFPVSASAELPSEKAELDGIMLLGTKPAASAAVATPGAVGTAGVVVADEAGVRKVLATYADARNRRDAHAEALCYTEDGDFLSSTGGAAVGRAAIEKTLTVTDPNYRFTLVIDTVRFLAPDVAVVDSTILGGPTRGTYVVVKRQAEWLISAARIWRPTAPAAPR